MIIGFDGSRAFNKNKTGTENYSYLLLKNLSEIDSKNQYIVYLRPGKFDIPNIFPENFIFKTLNYPYLWTQLGLAMELFTNPPDLLFVPAHTLPIIRPKGIKTVMTVHDLGSEYLPSHHQLKQSLYLKFITHYQMKSVNKLIAVSIATKNDLIKKIGVPESKVEVIYEGLRFEDAKRVEKGFIEQTLGKYNLKGKNFFLFVGTIQPRKNLARLIEAFAIVKQLYTIPKDFKLVLVGDSGWKNSDIYKLPEKMSISSSVKFLGRVNDRELGALYSSAEGFIFPSLFEGFGLPILEAFHFGCPVITSNISSLPEVAGDAALLVDPYQLNDLIKAMEELVINDDLRDRLIDKGYSRVKKFSFKKAAEQTLELFLSLEHH
jgi:glycosyltransferase involved in cell wall biosynthesis